MLLSYSGSSFKSLQIRMVKVHLDELNTIWDLSHTNELGSLPPPGNCFLSSVCLLLKHTNLGSAFCSMFFITNELNLDKVAAMVVIQT